MKLFQRLMAFSLALAITISAIPSLTLSVLAEEATELGQSAGRIQPLGINGPSASILGQDNPKQNLTFTIDIENASDVADVTVLYQQAADVVFSKKAMSATDSNTYTAVLNRSDIWASSLKWQVQVKYNNELDWLSSLNDTAIVCAVGAQQSSPLLITEIVPTATKGYHYTYLEVYNNSTQTIDLKDYTVFNQWSDKGWNEWTFDGKSQSVSNGIGTNYHPAESIPLAAGNSIIMWPTNQAHTLEDFNSFYGTDVQPEQIVKVAHGGISPTDQRTFSIGKTINTIVATAVSNNGKVEDNPDRNVNTKYANQYTYRIDGKAGYKYTKTAAPTPGTVAEWQIPDQPYDLDAENATIHPISDSDLIYQASYGAADPVTIQAKITGASSNISANLYYSQNSYEVRKLEMEKGADSLFSVTISRSVLWADDFTWYIQADDGTNSVKSAEKTSAVVSNVDYSSVPPLIFTEAVPVYKTGTQATYAELYNNSDKAINMGYYNLYYQYLDSSTAPKTWTISTPELLLEPGKTLILWLSNNGTAVEQFNDIFDTDLEENKDIVRIDYSGFHASNWRKLSIGHTLETAFTHAEFNENNAADVTSGSNRSVQYTYPRDASNKSLKVTTQKAPSPGSVEEWQVPPADKRAHFEGYPEYEDTGAAPVITAVNVPDAVNEGEEYFATFLCSDAIGLSGMTIGYRFDGETKLKTIYEKSQRVKGKFFARIPANEILNHNSIQFYVEGYNLYRKTTTQTYTVNVNRLKANGLRLNVGDGKVLAGVKTITASNGGSNADTQIFVEGEQTETQRVLENGAFFSLSTGDQNNYFKNAVTAPYGDNDREIISYLGRWTNLSSRAVLVDNKYFQIDANGDYSIKLTVWAGGQGTAFEDIYKPDLNREDFTVSNVKLVLVNGEEFLPHRAVQDYQYTEGSFSLDVKNPAGNRIYNVGDSKNGKMAPSLDLYFKIPKEKLTAVGYELDTTKLSDGKYTIKATSGSLTQTASILVDNTAPSIGAGIEEGALVSGTLQINPEVIDENGLDISQYIVSLDGKAITVPYSVPTRELSPGAHTLHISALDIGGNEAQKTVAFYTDTKDPAGITAKAVDITANQAKLSVSVGELNGSSAAVDFYKGRILTLENGEISVTKGVGNKPIEVVNGNSNITVTSPDGDLPYQIFTIQVGNTEESDNIAANWNGTANYADASRALSMYVLNLANNQWELLSRADAAGNINTFFTAKNHVENGAATLLVQCRADDNPGVQRSAATIAAAQNAANSQWDGTGRPDNYDFAFAWITDTQYYSESWPQHYLQQNQWLVDNADEWNIRYTMHTGDIVDEWDMDDQWQLADKAMKIFDDNGMRYGVLGGNHDVAAGLQYYDNYWKYFGTHRFEDSPIYGGSYNNNLGHYDLVTENGQDFIILYMSWDIYTNEINWMNQILQKYSDRKAIIATHRYTNAKFASGNPDGLLDYQGYVLREQVVAKNPNVFAVLNGHYHGASIQVDGFDDDRDGIKERSVYQICTDYQSDVEGGSQYIKFLYFDLQNNKVYMNSYSPYRQDFNYFDEPKLDAFPIGLQKADYDIYELDVPFDTAAKSLNTSRFTASVLTQEAIGKAQTATETAQVLWTGLKPNTNYSWYAAVTNENGGLSTTPVNVFRTRTATNNGGGQNSGRDDSSDDRDTKKTLGDTVKASPDYSEAATHSDASGRISFSKIENEMTKVAGSFSNSVTIRTKNAKSISPATIQSILRKAAELNKNITLHADTMSSAVNAVQGRLYLDLTQLQNTASDLQLGVYTALEKTANTKGFFKKYFNNSIEVVSLAQAGSFGARLQVAAKVDLSKLAAETLFFYSYNQNENTYTRISTPSYSVDQNGYLHFYTQLGGSIIISDKPLNRK
ncbi:metallophosphoesterase [Oscillospiraceae bacterium MB08-C2-2]|nr:metallophosphoesterase [Oscillospiraceae bacterium MB08-C2-2]